MYFSYVYRDMSLEWSFDNTLNNARGEDGLEKILKKTQCRYPGIMEPWGAG